MSEADVRTHAGARLLVGADFLGAAQDTLRFRTEITSRKRPKLELANHVELVFLGNQD
jgi:hypothetical protein